MVSTEAKMTAARACVVLSTIAAGLSIAAVLRLPLFELKMDSINSSITQSLFTTDIYTPVVEKHISAREFTEKCENLQSAFRVAQVGVIAAVVLLGLAMICGVLHLAPSFTKTNQSVRRVCGAPICILLVLALVVMGWSGFLMHGVFENDTWCKQTKGDSDIIFLHHVDPQQQSQATRILRQPERFAQPAVLRVRAAHGSPLVLQQQQQPLQYHQNSVEVPLQEPKCNYFNDCFASYRAMGFEYAVGYQVLWAAVGVAAFAMVVEMMVMAVGASVVPQAGIAAETAALLSQQDDNDRLI